MENTPKKSQSLSWESYKNNNDLHFKSQVLFRNVHFEYNHLEKGTFATYNGQTSDTIAYSASLVLFKDDNVANLIKHLEEILVTSPAQVEPFMSFIKKHPNIKNAITIKTTSKTPILIQGLIPVSMESFGDILIDFKFSKKHNCFYTFPKAYTNTANSGFNQSEESLKETMNRVLIEQK